jgi:hypothetical protein
LNLRPDGPDAKRKANDKDKTERRASLTAFRVVASVSWGRGESISAETVRFGKDQ